MNVRGAFREATGLFLDVVGTVRRDSWAAPGLGVWTVRDLVGHASRAYLTVEEYATVGSARVGIGTASDIAERGRQAGLALGEEPAAAVRQIAERVLTLVEGLSDEHELRTSTGAVSLGAYLPSRVAEVTVHTMDLARALDVPATPGDVPARVTLDWLMTLAVRQGRAREVIDGLTGRSSLESGFSLVP